MSTTINHGQIAKVEENGDVSVFYPKTFSQDVYVNDEKKSLKTFLGTTDISTIGDGTISGAISAINSNKQNATDLSLKTTSKTIVGGINEVYDMDVNKSHIQITSGSSVFRVQVWNGQLLLWKSDDNQQSWTAVDHFTTTTELNNSLQSKVTNYDITQIFRRYGLNEIDINNTPGNWSAGVTVGPTGGWCNIIQFECDHFFTQVALPCSVDSSSLCSPIMTRHRYAINGWSGWAGFPYDVAMQNRIIGQVSSASMSSTDVGRIGYGVLKFDVANRQIYTVVDNAPYLVLQI